MWHLKTKLGIFWVIPVSEVASKYYLGVNDTPLAEYRNAEQAARDVYSQATGYFKWDCEARVKAPEHLHDWQEGEPRDWR